MSLTKRATKGSALTYSEMDTNFQTLWDRDVDNEVITEWAFTNFDPNTYTSASNMAPIDDVQITTTGEDIEILAQLSSNILSNTLNASNLGRRIVIRVTISPTPVTFRGGQDVVHYHDYVASHYNTLYVRTNGLSAGTYTVFLKAYALGTWTAASDVQIGDGFMTVRELKAL